MADVESSHVSLNKCTKMKQKSEQGKLELEKARMELEYLKLKLLQESKMNTDSSVESTACGSFPLHQNLKLVPKFNEHDPDVFFFLFLNVSLKYRVGPKQTVCCCYSACWLVRRS